MMLLKVLSPVQHHFKCFSRCDTTWCGRYFSHCSIARGKVKSAKRLLPCWQDMGFYCYATLFFLRITYDPVLPLSNYRLRKDDDAHNKTSSD